MIISGSPRSKVLSIYLTLTPSSISKAPKSVKLEILGYLITAISMSPILAPVDLSNLSVRESSSSTLIFI